MREVAYREHYAVEDRHWWYRGRWAVVEALIARAGLPPRPRILDAGCGTGGYLSRYARLGEAVGIEPSAEAVEFCRSRGLHSVRQAGLEDLPLEDESFDLAIATDVVEHVAAEHQALSELQRVTAIGGVVILTVPAYMWMWSDEDVNLHHQRRYTLRGLRQAVSEAGLQPEFGTYYNSILLPPIVIARKLKRGRTNKGELEQTPAFLDTPLSLPMRIEARMIKAGLRLPAGVSVGLICRRRV